MDETTCPVCEGRGTMPGAFYGMPEAMVTCRSCGGRQVVPTHVAEAAATATDYDPRDLTGS